MLAWIFRQAEGLGCGFETSSLQTPEKGFLTPFRGRLRKWGLSHSCPKQNLGSTLTISPLILSSSKDGR